MTRHFGINTTAGAESENHRRHYSPQQGTIWISYRTHLGCLRTNNVNGDLVRMSDQATRKTTA